MKIGGFVAFAAATTTACSSSDEATEMESEGAAEARICGGPSSLLCPTGFVCQLEGRGAGATGRCVPDPGGSEVPVWDRCETDRQCVAVPRVGCCEDGWKEAVNPNQVAAYEASFDKSTCGVACPAIVISDKRQAQCDHQRGQCEMVEIRDIVCGGNSPNPHRCPTGYTCKTPAGGPVDGPGRCVSETPEPDDGCGGCPTGAWCSFCWGQLVCIPVTASC